MVEDVDADRLRPPPAPRGCWSDGGTGFGIGSRKEIHRGRREGSREMTEMRK
jgi:hypothetical protein